MASLQKQFENLSIEFSESQTTLNELMAARSKLETQFQENKMVLDEFAYLNEESKIYKLTGPILMPQDYSEAKINVEKRIAFIQDEIKRIETKIMESQKQLEDTRSNLLDIKTKLST